MLFTGRALCRRMVVVLLLACLAVTGKLFAALPVSTEYQLKSVLLYKLTRFVDWPNPPGLTGHFKICVLGRDDFGNTLSSLEKHKVKGVPIRVLHFAQSEDVDKSCHILFISASKQPFIKPIVKQLDAYPILTVGESDRFAKQGGMIHFVLKDKKIGFHINLQKVRHCRLKIAAPLLQMSTIVKVDQP